MPILFFYFIGTVTGGGLVGGGEGGRPDALLLESAAGADDPLVAELVTRLEAEGFAVSPEPDPETAPLRTLRVVAAAEDEPDLLAAVAAGRRVTLRLRHREATAAMDFDRVRAARAVYGLLADVVVASESDGVVSAAAVRAVRERPRALSLEVTRAGRRRHAPSGFEQAIPGTMVMFTMLVLLTSGAIALVVEREQGLLRRLAATPIPRGAVVAGKWGARMAVGAVQVGFAMVAGRALFGMDWGRALWAVLLVLAAWAAFNASLGLLLANLARSQAQMAGLAVLATMVLAALGGCWWPIEVTPEWMQRVALALPTGWTMDALHRLVSFGDPGVAALPHAAALAVGALLAGWAAARTFRYY